MRQINHAFFFKESEASILSSICAYLRMKKRFWWRQNNHGVYDQKKGIYRRNANTLRGIPDLFVVDGSRLMALEVKSYDGRLSPDQKDFGEAFHCPPHREFHVVRSVSDVVVLGL